VNSHEVPDAKLQEVARRLGARAAERLDVEHTAQAVVARLRAEPRVAGGRWAWIQPAWMRIAAAVVLVVGVGGVVRTVVRNGTTPEVASVGAGAELNDLSTEQLRAVLETVEQPAPEEAISAQDVSLEDLSAPQLRALLESLEGGG
jgi:hypothetical protein